MHAGSQGTSTPAADDAQPAWENVVVIGPGLIGGSFGQALRTAKLARRVVGVSRRQQTLDTAQQRGCIDAGTTDLVAACRAADLILVAPPLSMFDQVFADIARSGNTQALLTDAGSTKLSVIASAQTHLLPAQLSHFVPAHPMAGSEKQGPEAAQPQLFRGRPCVLCPLPQTDEAALQRIADLWLALGMHLLRMTADEHDAKSAVISHLPHLASVMLTEVARELGGTEIASTGFRDTTRLASSNPTIRADILACNRDAVLRTLDALEARLYAWRAAVATDDRAQQLRLLENAQTFRDQWVAQFVQREGGESAEQR